MMDENLNLQTLSAIHGVVVLNHEVVSEITSLVNGHPLDTYPISPKFLLSLADTLGRTTNLVTQLTVENQNLRDEIERLSK